MRDDGQRRSNMRDGVDVQAEGCEELHFQSTKGTHFTNQLLVMAKSAHQTLKRWGEGRWSNRHI